MLSEALSYLNLAPGKIIVDGTLGGTGHAKAICEKILPNGKLIGIDQDSDAILNAKQKLSTFESNIHLFHDNFVHLGEILTRLGVDGVDGILLDLGLSMHHLESSQRGFSFKRKETLDMRMNTNISTTAADLVNQKKEGELAALFRTYGEERRSKQIAKKIVAARKKEKIRYSNQLADIILEAIPPAQKYNQKIHPATRVFMALRIAVNDELTVLEEFMKAVPDYLNPCGRLCVLSYHSLEDRIVKQQIRIFEKGCTCPPDFPKCVCGKVPQMKSITRKVLRPSDEEIEQNPMARSAKLRVAEKL